MIDDEPRPVWMSPLITVTHKTLAIMISESRMSFFFKIERTRPWLSLAADSC